MKRTLALVLSLQFAVAPATHAFAAPSGKAAEAEAARLKKQGDKAMMDLQYDDAIAAYDASYALHANPALHYNRGRALEALGRHADALAAYERFEKEAPADLKAKVAQLPQHIEELKKKVTRLTLDVTPSGARVILRGTVLGSAPVEPLSVNAGKAHLEVSADGYAPYSKDVDLPGGEALTLRIDLSAKSAKVETMLVLKSDPAATATIDGKGIGTTPLELEVAPGTHTIVLDRDGYSTRTSTVVVAAGERKEVTLTLDSTPGIASKWWFWTGVGAVVIGGTALTIGLLTTKDAGKGDIAPGRISAPLIRF